MTSNILRHYVDYLTTGSLAALLVGLLIFQPNATVALAFLCGVTLYLSHSRGGRLLARLWQRLYSLPVAYALAALFLLTVPLIRYWTIDQLSQPTLIPIDSLISAPDGGTKTIQLPAGADQFLLILNLRPQRQYTDYTVQILDPSDPAGKAQWSRTGLEASAAGNFNLKMRRGFLGAGPHEIRLFGREGGISELVAEYKVQIADG